MNAAETKLEAIVTVFKGMKPSERESVLARILTETALSEEMSDSLDLEVRRRQRSRSFRKVIKNFRVRV